MRRPNFFIVGAPKCGTTALSEYLRGHPQVFMSWPKEPWYFCSDFHHWPMPFVRTERAYLNLFRKASPEVPVVGEGSAGYILSKVAIQRILQFAPEAKIILMLRNPIDFVCSLHNQLLWDLEEDVEDFRLAWDLQESRQRGKSVPSKCRIPELLQYREVALMAPRVGALLARTRPENVKVLLLEEFAQETRDVYLEVLRFLDIQDDHREEFPRVNASKRIAPKLSWLAQVNQRPPDFLRTAVDHVKRLLGQRHRQLLAPIYRREPARQPLDQEFRADLQRAFANDVERLSKLLRRDLSIWDMP